MAFTLEPRNRWRSGGGPGAAYNQTPFSASGEDRCSTASVRCCPKAWGVDLSEHENGVHCTFNEQFLSQAWAGQARGDTNSFSDSHSWDSQSTQLSSLASGPVLPPQCAHDLIFPQGPASLSASWGPHGTSGLCCVLLASEISLPSGRSSQALLLGKWALL